MSTTDDDSRDDVISDDGLAVLASAVWQGDIDEIDFEQLQSLEGVHVVDVRAPREFEDDRIPGSVSVPVFSDEERATVGSLYRARGSVVAQQWGTQRVLQRLPEFTTRLVRGFGWSPQGGPAAARGVGIVACARGGLRSEAVTRLLSGAGFPVMRLRGGYRAYRARVRADIEGLQLPPMFVLEGLTGCGKTRVLRCIHERSPQLVLDLEGMAQHRSSVFGDVGLEPVSQKCFESRLVARAKQLRGACIMEWEARRLGNREVPGTLHEQGWNAPWLRLRASIDRRVELLCDEYMGGERSVHEATQQMRQRLPALRRFGAIGDDGVRHLDELLQAGAYPEVARSLLELHYDPRYAHGHAGHPFAASFHVADGPPLQQALQDVAEQIHDWIRKRVGEP